MFRAFDTSVRRLPFRALHQVPTLIGCLLLKNWVFPTSPRSHLLLRRFVFAAVKSFCLSAAEKRDYEASFLSRQLLFAEFFASLRLPNPLAHAALLPIPHAVADMLHHPLPLLFPVLLRAFFVALLNGSRTIASLYCPWQALFGKYFIDHFGNDENTSTKRPGAACAAPGLVLNRSVGWVQPAGAAKTCV